AASRLPEVEQPDDPAAVDRARGQEEEEGQGRCGQESCHRHLACGGRWHRRLACVGPSRPAATGREASMTEQQVSPEKIMQFWFSLAPALMVEAAIQCRVFDVLDGGPKTVPQVAQATGASERGLRALLNGLVAIELLAKQGDAYMLTPTSAAF